MIFSYNNRLSLENTKFSLPKNDFCDTNLKAINSKKTYYTVKIFGFLPIQKYFRQARVFTEIKLIPFLRN